MRPLGEVCEVVAGQSPEGRFYNTRGGGLPFYQGKKDFGPRYLEPPSKWTTRVTKVAERGDVLMSVRAPVGPVNIAPERICIGRGLAAIAPGPAIDRDFLYMQLQALEGKLAGSEGAVFPSISKAQIEAIPLAVPPLGEQEQIVRILNEAISGLGRAKEKVVKGSLKVQALVDQFLDSTVTSMADRWPVRPLGEIADFRNGVNYTKSSTGPKVAVIGVKDFQDHFYAPQDGLARVQLDRPLDAEDGVQSGDLLIVRSNGNPNLIGRCMVVADLDDQVAHSGFTIRARLRTSESLMPVWVAWVLRSRSSRRLMVDQGTGTNIRSLNQGVLASIPVPLPPRSVQEIITDTLTRVNATAMELRQSLAARLSAVDELRASLFHQAFTGQL